MQANIDLERLPNNPIFYLKVLGFTVMVVLYPLFVSKTV